ncbi:MAG: DUF1622 domain-containing protein [Gemmataceae bacterium]|nr:DUF1622 domain-containing protein [Gemmataceae bacterium]
MEEYSRAAALHLAAGVQLAAAAIVTVACVRAAVRAFALLARRDVPGTETEATRLALGRWLVLALEFQVAADILRTAATPTWTDLGQLAAVIVLRTVLNYVLRKEIAESAARELGGEGTPPPPGGPTVPG